MENPMNTPYGTFAKVTSQRLINSADNVLGQEMIMRRVNEMNVARLMKLTTKKEQFERNNWGYSRWYSYRYPFPNLSDNANNGMLRYAAMQVLGRSQEGVLMETLVDKVLVLCAILSDQRTHSHLDIELIMKTLDNVFNHPISLSEPSHEKLERIESLLISLNRSAQSRARAAAAAAPAQPMEEIDGGFYKKNYKRSIKTRKSRKLRSRR
jgi:hypothetical protein